MRFLLKAGAVAALFLALAPAATGDTFTNRKTGETLQGQLLGTFSVGGRQHLYVKTDSGARRQLLASEWTVQKSPDSSSPAREGQGPGHGPTPSVHAEGLVKVIASGAGTTPDEARNSALSAAVEQACGVLVDAETSVDQNDVIKEKIITATNAYVSTVRNLRRWQQEGVHHCSIVAYVQPRKLRERLKASNLNTVQIDGESLDAEIFTKWFATKMAAALVKKCLADLPQKVLTVRVTGKPVPVSSPDLRIPEGQARLRIPIEIAVEQRAYAQAIAEAETQLAEIATARSTGTVRYETGPPGEEGPGLNSGEGQSYMDNNPVSPRPGWLAPRMWFRLNARSRYPAGSWESQIYTPYTGVHKECLSRGKRTGVILLMGTLARRGNARVVAFAVDEEAARSIPETGHVSAAVVRLELTGSAGKKIATTDIKCSAGWFILTTWDPEGEPLVLTNPGVWSDYRGTDIAQSWYGYAYIDVPRDKVKDLKEVRASVRWAPDDH